MNMQMVISKTGLTKRMIRHYEEIGLIRPTRSQNNYREYSEAEVHRLLCIKALKSIGFGLEEITKILKEENLEEVLGNYLKSLLAQRQEAYLELKDHISTIKKLINTKNNVIPALFDRIASVQAPRVQIQETEGLTEFFKRNDAIAGGLKAADEFAKIAALGPESDFKILEVEYTSFASVFGRLTNSNFSLCSCPQIFAMLTLFTEAAERFDKAFHKVVWNQFTEFWSRVSIPLTLEFEAYSNDIQTAEGLFGYHDIAMVLKAENPRNDRFEIVVPGQPLVVLLRAHEGLTFSDGPPKISPIPKL